MRGQVNISCPEKAMRGKGAVPLSVRNWIVNKTCPAIVTEPDG